jgi:uncharacterized SAM-binding protein YcdF (DUF218 family)
VFFIASKIFGYIFLLANFLIGMGFLGAVLMLTRLKRTALTLMIASSVLLAACGFSPLGSLLLSPLETRFPPWDPARGAPDGIIVLGGSIDPDLSATYGRAVVRADADRIIATAQLALRYPNARIVFSGGSANLVWTGAKEADYAGALLESLGVDRSRIQLERLSRNTDENAEFSKELVHPREGERWLLITSAYHMSRSIGLFRKANFPVEAYPVDWRLGSRADLLGFSKIAGSGIARTDLAVREWIGLIAYWMSGKIDEPFPGPH